MSFKQLIELKKLVDSINKESQVYVLTLEEISMFKDGCWACSVRTSSIFVSYALLRLVVFCIHCNLSAFLGSVGNKPYLSVQ